MKLKKKRNLTGFIMILFKCQPAATQTPLKS